ncbi:MAG: hypothetical protein H7096_12145 [Flavobacterium sp.]|nr:hypothetical protein [Pedobacter sp.]
MIVSKKLLNGVEIIIGENDYIRFEVAPAAGGKIISVYNKQLCKEFLWTNKNLTLETHQSGADYDTHFFGGIDELIPNDIPEIIDSIAYPDHGELWTTTLQYKLFDDQILVYGKLKLSGLSYKKTIYLDANSPTINLEYTIKNETNFNRNFLWKLHVALAIEEGDQLISSAKKAKVVDPAYSRFKNLNEFNWPEIENVNASVVPVMKNNIDFFYLYDVENGEMKMLSEKNNQIFNIGYEKKVFPYQWYFASYGGFLDHHTAILEPCTSMPLSVNEAKILGQSKVLKPNEEINTIVRIYAGEKI